MASKVFEIEGRADRRFRSLRDTFISNFENDLECGASVAVTIGGEGVVDLWGGFAEPRHKVPWQRDTLVNVFSSTKVIAALCLMVLVERGLVDLDAPVCRYWPEFARGGKQSVRVRWLLSHRSGLSGFNEILPRESLYDRSRVVAMLEGQCPWWEPGSRAGYHLVTYGFLLGELVQRVTGVSLGNFLRTEIAGPLGADFYIGLPPEHDHRVAELIPPPAAEATNTVTGDESIAARTLNNPVMSAEMAQTLQWRRAEIPASNGHGNARSMARLGAVLAGSGALGKTRILSRNLVDRAFEEQGFDTDLVLGVPVRWGLGFALSGPHRPFMNPETAYWGGTGGSFLLMDRRNDLCFAYAMNLMRNEPAVMDPRGKALRDALFTDLRVCDG